MTPTPRAWLRVACWGALAVGLRGLLSAAPATDLAAIERALGFLLAVAAPAILALHGPRWAARLVWIAALSALLSDPLAGAARWIGVAPWLLVCGALAGHAARELARRRCVPSALRLVAHVFLLVGAGWLLASRAEVELPGLDPGKVLLACAHATVVGFAALSLMGQSAERVPRARGPLAALGALLGLGFAVTGVGIAFAPALEPLGAALLLVALGGYAGFLLLWQVPGERSLAARGALGLAALALLTTVGLGALFSLRHAGAPAIPRATMILAHGWGISLGFALLGSLGQLLARATRDAATELPVLLFDGECGMCTRSVQTILDLERTPSVRFAPLQGPTAQALLGRVPVAPPGGPFDSLLLVHELGGPGERVHQRWRAVCGIGARMGQPWRALAGLGWLCVPPALADLGYALVARNRLRFGGPQQCKIPTAAQRARFLD